MAMDERAMKAMMIAAMSKLEQNGNTWLVPSQAGKGKYTVDPSAKTCTCPDFELRHLPCKHVMAVEIVVKREHSIEQTPDGIIETITETKSVKVTYSQDWPAYDAAQQNEKALLQKLLNDLCKKVANAPQVMGRPSLAYGDMIFSAVFKVYSTVSHRRFTTDLREAQGKGYIAKTPCFNSVSSYLNDEDMTPILKQLIAISALPLKSLETDFAVDSTGFALCQYKRWFDAKYGREMKEQDWVKCHLICGVKTNVVTSVEITDAYTNDSPLLPQLVNETSANFNMQVVLADKGYSSLDNHNAIADVKAVPYIAFKSNTTGGVGGTFEYMFHYFNLHRKRFLVEYHKRSNVESTMHMIKSKFGTFIRAKNRTAQINEALCKVLCHNLCCLIQSMFEFGITPDFE
jgi:transposase